MPRTDTVTYGIKHALLPFSAATDFDGMDPFVYYTPSVDKERRGERRMFVIEGKCGTADYYATSIEERCIERVKGMLDMPFAADANTAIMPDAHLGRGCAIGTTMRAADKVVPDLMAMDIVDVMRPIHNFKAS